jgi:hypothetical protein
MCFDYRKSSARCRLYAEWSIDLARKVNFIDLYTVYDHFSDYTC